MDNTQVMNQLVDKTVNRYFGKYRGLVKDNRDPTNRGRIKVRLTSTLADDLTWAMPCFPFTGNNMGVFMIPEVDTGVWVEFEGGDLANPIWTGGYWADDHLPKDQNGNTAVPSLKIIRSQRGLMITMDDKEEIITVCDTDGSNIMTIDVKQGKIRLQGNMKIVVEAPLIELVENATHPVVFGDDLLNYLNQLVNIYQAHTHPGQLALGVLPVTPAPPVPPFPPATPALLSTIVKAG